jgi:hypothetical protein
VQGRLDNINRRIERVERRLELVEVSWSAFQPGFPPDFRPGFA